MKGNEDLDVVFSSHPERNYPKLHIAQMITKIEKWINSGDILSLTCFFNIVKYGTPFQADRNQLCNPESPYRADKIALNDPAYTLSRWGCRAIMSIPFKRIWLQGPVMFAVWIHDQLCSLEFDNPSLELYSHFFETIQHCIKQHDADWILCEINCENAKRCSWDWNGQDHLIGLDELGYGRDEKGDGIMQYLEEIFLDDGVSDLIKNEVVLTARDIIYYNRRSDDDNFILTESWTFAEQCQTHLRTCNVETELNWCLGMIRISIL